MSMKFNPLEDVLNSIVEQFDLQAITSLAEEDHSKGNAELDEVSLYCEVDPLLSDLYKEYKNAKAQHESLKRTAPKNDPMLDVAADMVDSAWCMVTTRVLELREDEEATEMMAMRMAQSAPSVSSDEAGDNTEKKRAKISASGGSLAHDKDPEFIALLKRQKEIDEARNKARHDDFIFCFLMLYIAQRWASKAKTYTSSLHHSFAQAA